MKFFLQVWVVLSPRIVENHHVIYCFFVLFIVACSLWFSRPLLFFKTSAYSIWLLSLLIIVKHNMTFFRTNTIQWATSSLIGYGYGYILWQLLQSYMCMVDWRSRHNLIIKNDNKFISSDFLVNGTSDHYFVINLLLGI